MDDPGKLELFHQLLQTTMSQKRKSSLKQHGSNKRRSRQPPVEEVTFNFTDREAYLTGFHKRKLQRINHAKETAAKKEREDKLAARKQVSLKLSSDLLALTVEALAATRRA